MMKGLRVLSVTRDSRHVAQLLDAAADEWPQRPALACGRERMTWADLRERVDRLAQGLASRGLRPGDPVALLLPNVPAFAISFLAGARIGAVVVPLNPQLKKAELAFYFSDCGVRAVITDRPSICHAIVPRASRWGEAAEIFTTGGAPGPLSVDSLMEDHAPSAFEGPASGEDAIFQYSSGSTGRPKRVPRTHRQLCSEADSFVATTGLTAADTIFCSIPLFHTYGLGCCLLAAVRSGATLAMPDGAGPLVLGRERILRALERDRASVFPAVPFTFRLLAEAVGGADLSAIRLCFSAGSALPRSTFDAFDRRFGIPIRQLYGCTETGAVTVNLDTDPWTTAASVGRPIQDVRVEIRDTAGNTLEVGRIGEIAIGSPAMTRGYAGVEEQINRQALPDGWFLTGDRGRLDEAGRLSITGRRKLLIDVQGDKVDPIEVEDVLAVHPKVREVVVVGVESGVDGVQTVKAIVVPDGSCGERELVRFCRERLANYKVPQMVEFRDEIPKSSLGKVLRKQLV